MGMTGIKHESNEMQNIKSRNIKTVVAIMLISLCWMKILDAQIIPTNGLIAHYPFNGNANDESGNGNNPIGLYFMPASDVCGSSGSAYKSGILTHIYLPPDSFISRNEYSYSLWFKADFIPPLSHWILFSVGSLAEGFEQAFAFNSDRTLAGISSNNGNNPALTTINSAPVDTGRWIHGVLTRDNTNLRIFINGILAASSSLDSLTPGQDANYGLDPIATIGCHWGETSYDAFIGSIDEVRIYSRVLNEEEIKQLAYTECALSDIFGPTEICQGQSNVAFSVEPLNNVSNYAWNYLGGAGATIYGNGSSAITVDFADNATNGTLTVTATGDFIDTKSRSIDIQVNTLPLDAGIISGEPEVCQGDKGVIYTVPEIDYAKSYNWSYSGTGALILDSTHTVSIDFTSDAANGILTVAGNNVCGNGSSSPPFPIVIGQLPSNPGTITGESIVCMGQQEITYSIPVIQNATGYIWSYRGVILTGDSNTITMDFNSSSTSGDLTVVGTNSCGNSVLPAILPLTVLSIPSEAGIISGNNPVCLNQNGVSYSVPSIDFATSYLWEFSGTGAVLTGNSTSVVMDFSAQATGGNLTVTGQNNCGEGVQSPEFLITVNDCSVNPSEISIPNSFSPNGDGVNDVFFIRGLPENSTLIIFDRAGNTLFESLSYTNNWDGKDRAGKALASGTYWYVLSVSGQPEEYKGFVYLKR
jgi:gliding motility-associated-like protein